MRLRLSLLVLLAALIIVPAASAHTKLGSGNTGIAYVCMTLSTSPNGPCVYPDNISITGSGHTYFSGSTGGANLGTDPFGVEVDWTGPAPADCVTYHSYTASAGGVFNGYQWNGSRSFQAATGCYWAPGGNLGHMTIVLNRGAKIGAPTG